MNYADIKEKAEIRVKVKNKLRGYEEKTENPRKGKK